MVMRRHLVTLGLGASLLLAVGSAVEAKDAHIASVLGADVVLSIPKGYCPLDKTTPADKAAISTLEQVNAGRNAILLMFADCKQLEAFRTMGQSLSNSGAYMAPASARRPIKTSRAQFVAEIAQVIKQRQLPAKGHEEAKQRVKELNAGVEIARNVDLGLLHSDDTAVYTGVLQTWQAEGGGTIQVVTIASLTLVRERVISVNLSVPVDGKDPVPALLAAQRGIVKALIAANN
jgi:hypothetical protein